MVIRVVYVFFLMGVAEVEDGDDSADMLLSLASLLSLGTGTGGGTNGLYLPEERPWPTNAREEASSL